MVALVTPTTRSRQRYVNGCRLVAGCIPYRYSESCDACNVDAQGAVEVLMVTPHRGEGLLFPKGGWETNETQKQAACRETLEEAGVKGKIKVTMEEAMKLCKKLWMRKALERCTYFFKGGYADYSASDSPSHVLEDEEYSEQSACEEMVPECADNNVASDDDVPSFTTEENTTSSSD